MSGGKEIFRAWIEAVRPRTIPVSVAGVLAGTGCAALYNRFQWLPALICLVFAIIAQVASNLANEYYDYAYGLDKKGRQGFRRGVTEGDLNPKSMFLVTYALVILDSLLGLSLIYWGGWWLLIPGAAIAIFALAYSAGPYPLSHHGLGDVAVIIFFGIVPVALTCYVQTEAWEWNSLSIPMGFAVGLASANVLIVNNYRDADDDRLVCKRTTVVIFGRKIMSWVYLYFGVISALIIVMSLGQVSKWFVIPAGVYLTLHIMLWQRLRNNYGSKLNSVLGQTAANLLLLTLGTIFLCFFAKNFAG